jgi:hypothetical protein
VHLGGVIKLFFIEVEDENFVSLREKMASEAPSNSLGGCDKEVRSLSVILYANAPPEIMIFLIGGAVTAGVEMLLVCAEDMSCVT